MRIRAFTALALGWLTLPAAALACGETTIVTPAGIADPPLVVGDSLLYGAADAVARQGFAVDGMVCRRMDQGIALLRPRAARLPHLVVVELANNSPVTHAEIVELLGVLGPGRMLALLTAHNGVAPAASNAVIRSAAGEYPGRVGVLDWAAMSAGHPGWFAADGLHLGTAAGIAAFSGLIGSARQWAATVPAAAAPANPAPTETPAAPTVTSPPPVAPPRPAPPAAPVSSSVHVALAGVEAAISVAILETTSVLS